jgi:hypothetical protein
MKGARASSTPEKCPAYTFLNVTSVNPWSGAMIRVKSLVVTDAGPFA